MASTSPVFLRLMANAVAVANHAGTITFSSYNWIEY